MASNTTTQADQNGEFDDWIELYNNTGIDLSLNGYYLTDDSLDLMQWAFPDTCIGANDYLIIWADKDDDTQTGLHASFKLSASEESVFLVNDVLEIVNTVSFIDQVTDIAYARVPNGTGNFVAQNPTFGSNNDLANNINENIYTPEIQAYPNPFKSSFTIEGNLENNTYSIVNITGQLISSGTLTNDQNTIDSSDWDTGIYILKIKNSFIKLVKN
jgi:hypothetical protein